MVTTVPPMAARKPPPSQTSIDIAGLPTHFVMLLGDTNIPEPVEWSLEIARVEEEELKKEELRVQKLFI